MKDTFLPPPGPAVLCDWLCCGRCVLLYPNGNQPDRQGYVSLYLYRWDKQTEPVAATFRFSLLNSAREKSFTVDVAEKKEKDKNIDIIIL